MFKNATWIFWCRFLLAIMLRQEQAVDMDSEILHCLSYIPREEESLRSFFVGVLGRHRDFRDEIKEA